MQENAADMEQKPEEDPQVQGEEEQKAESTEEVADDVDQQQEGEQAKQEAISPMEQEVAKCSTAEELVQLAQDNDIQLDTRPYDEFAAAVQKIHDNDMMAAVEAKMKEAQAAKAQQQDDKQAQEGTPPANPEEAVDQAAEKKADAPQTDAKQDDQAQETAPDATVQETAPAEQAAPVVAEPEMIQEQEVVADQQQKAEDSNDTTQQTIQEVQDQKKDEDSAAPAATPEEKQAAAEQQQDQAQQNPEEAQQQAEQTQAPPQEETEAKQEEVEAQVQQQVEEQPDQAQSQAAIEELLAQADTLLASYEALLGDLTLQCAANEIETEAQKLISDFVDRINAFGGEIDQMVNNLTNAQGAASNAVTDKVQLLNELRGKLGQAAPANVHGEVTVEGVSEPVKFDAKITSRDSAVSDILNAFQTAMEQNSNKNEQESNENEAAAEDQPVV
jgi:hypothetical protein